MADQPHIEWHQVNRLGRCEFWETNGEPQYFNETVQFYHVDLPTSDQVASLDGYDFFIEKTAAARVHILNPDAEVFIKAGLDGKQVTAETKAGVRHYLQSRMNRGALTAQHGRITAVSTPDYVQTAAFAKEMGIDVSSDTTLKRKRTNEEPQN